MRRPRGVRPPGINLPVECDRRASSPRGATPCPKSSWTRFGPRSTSVQGSLALAAGRDPRTSSIRSWSAIRASTPQAWRRSSRMRGPAGAAGEQHRARRGAPERQARDADRRLDDLALLRVRARRDPRRREPRGRRSGRYLHRGRGRVHCRATTGRRRAPIRRTGTSGSRAASRPAGRVHRDGPDGGERRPALRRVARGAGRVRPAIAGAGGGRRRPGCSTGKSCRSA